MVSIARRRDSDTKCHVSLQVKFSIYLTAFQLSLVCLFLRFGAYAMHVDASVRENGFSVAHGGGVGRTEAEHILRMLTMQVC